MWFVIVNKWIVFLCCSIMYVVCAKRREEADWLNRTNAHTRIPDLSNCELRFCSLLGKLRFVLAILRVLCIECV